MQDRLRNFISVAVVVTVVQGCTARDQARVLTQSAVVHDEPSATTNEPAPEVIQQGDFQLKDLDTGRKYRRPVISGTLKNIGRRDYQFVEVTMACFDESGNLVETVTANKAGLKSGRSWRFKAPVKRTSEVHDISIKRMIGW